MEITILCGGVGGARFARAMAASVGQAQITAVVNTGDDMELHGLYISPDVDIVTYTLAGAVDNETGWGVAGDTRHVLRALRQYDGADTWFSLGDADLALHLYRTGRMRKGHRLTDITRSAAAARGVRATVLPVCDEPVPTRVVTDEGDFHFEEYLVRDSAKSAIRRIYTQNADLAHATPEVCAALAASELILFAPSNPFASIGTMLAVPGVRSALLAAHCPKIGVSPILGGKVVKGPAAQMLRDFGLPVSALGAAMCYRGLLDAFLIDEADGALVAPIEALGMVAQTAGILMDGGRADRELAQCVLDLAGLLKVRRP